MRKILLTLSLIIGISTPAIAEIPFDILETNRTGWNIKYFYRDQKTIVIQHHAGGRVDDELFRIQKLDRLGYKIALADYTVSAGTLWLRYPKERLCIDPKADFYFHQPHVKSNFGRPLPNKYHTDKFFKMLPKEVQNTLLKQKVPAWKKPDPDTNLPWIDYIRIDGETAIKEGWAKRCPDYVITSTLERLFGGRDKNVPPKSDKF